MYTHLILIYQALILPLLITNATPTPFQYHKAKYIFTALKYISIDFLTIKHWLTSCWSPIQPPSLLNVLKQAVCYCLEMYSNWIQNYKALICPFFSNNATPIPFQYYKPSCIVLIRNLLLLFLIFHALICSLLRTNAIPIPNKIKQAVFSWKCILNDF